MDNISLQFIEDELLFSSSRINQCDRIPFYYLSAGNELSL